MAGDHFWLQSADMCLRSASIDKHRHRKKNKAMVPKAPPSLQVAVADVSKVKYKNLPRT